MLNVRTDVPGMSPTFFISSHLNFKPLRDGEVTCRSLVKLRAEGVRAADHQLLRFFKGREVIGAPSTPCKGTNTPPSRSCQLRTQRPLHPSFWVTRCSTQQTAHHVERQNIPAQVHHSEVRGQSGTVDRTARSTECFDCGDATASDGAT